MKIFEDVKIWLKDPKKKSITLLGIYGIFFLFVFIFFNSSINTNINPVIETNEKTSIEYYTSMSNYNYKITYTSVDKIEIIEGIYYNGISLFNYNNTKYYYNNNLYVINNDTYSNTNIQYDISKVFSKNLSSIMNSLSEESKTTYKDGSIEANYTTDSNKIYEYLYQNTSDYNNLVSIKIKEKDSIITNITIDLLNLNLNLTKIEIEYSNINNIQSLEFNIDNYTYKESL